MTIITLQIITIIVSSLHFNGEEISVIGKRAFNSCYSFKSIKLSDSIKDIEEEAHGSGRATWAVFRHHLEVSRQASVYILLHLL